MDDHSIKATLSIGLPHGSGCHALRFGEEYTIADFELNCLNPPGEKTTFGTCYLDVIKSEDSKEIRDLVKMDVGPDCVGCVLKQFDCIPVLKRVEDGALLISLTLADRKILPEMIDELRCIGTRPQLASIVDLEHYENVAEINEGVLTEKEKEAITIAFECGYYNQPRGISLDGLADKLELATSSVSQRLNSAESKVFNELLNEV